MADQAELPQRSLKSVFEEALRCYNEIDSGNVIPSEQQPLIKKTIQLLEEATGLINIGEVFSSNELLDEVSTECIQYLAIPAMLGVLVGKLQSGDRLSNLEVSEIYYKDFLKRGKEYEIVPENLKIEVENAISSRQNLDAVVLDRNAKIRKYEEQKRLQSDLVSLKENLERADDEVRRKYFTLFVKNFVGTAEEELRSIVMEKPLAAMRKANPPDGKHRPKREAPPPLKPVIITRNEMQKKVYGMGYPSLPTMTVDEFYEDRVREGIFPTSGSHHLKALQDLVDPEVIEQTDEMEKVQKEIKEEADNPEDLERARAMDEYKDEHRRGWGNRYNRS